MPDRNALLELSAAIQSTRDLENLERQLLEIVSEAYAPTAERFFSPGETGD